MSELRLGDRVVGERHAPYFEADLAANHDGELARALRLVELAAEAGADAVKFQHFAAETIVSRSGFDGLKIAHQADWKVPVYTMYERASLPLDWTAALHERARACGVEFCTTPYHPDLAAAVEPYVRFFKIGSGDVTWPTMLRAVAATGKPVLLATGASDLADVERAMAQLSAEAAGGVVLMQCNTNYTGARENLGYLNLNVLRAYASRWPEAVLGLSDHTPGHTSCVAAAALGARVFEKHFTDDVTREGPDHGFSLTPATWRAMVDAVGDACAALGDGVKRVEANEQDAAVVQRRALRFARALPAGHLLGPGDLVAVRPCPPDGLAPWRLADVVGTRLTTAVAADDLVVTAHLVSEGRS